jgi:DNA polymerase epsilon subunit 1
MQVSTLNHNISVLNEFPQVQVQISDDPSLLVGLEWQRSSTRAMIRHFLHHNKVFNLMLEQSRYFHLPIGNMAHDNVLFGSDMFYARLLQRHNFILWWSPNHRPDLGGSETDDNTLLSELEDSTSVQQCKGGFYSNFCVELTIDSLAVSALLQSHRIQEIEGASSAITFDTVQQQAFLDDMITNQNQMLPSYDETALCSAAFRIMRSMVNGWFRDVSLNRNVYSDYQIVHFYRWIRSANSLMYDPALRRSLNNLMKKLFLQIISEFKLLGVDIIYADFNKIIINTKKKSVVDALSYADFICQSIRNKELFHSVNLSYKQCWSCLLWLDCYNYTGVTGQLPEELVNDIEEQNEGESKVDINWSICESLSENCQKELENFLTSYIEQLISGNEGSKVLKLMSHQIYDIVLTLHQSSGRSQEGPALDFIKTLVKILSVDVSISEELNSLRRDMLRLVGIGEFSEKAEWKDEMKSYMLTEIICQACNYCRDLDLMKDKHRAIKDGTPIWYCSQCYVNYENEEIEKRLLDILNRKLMSYTLQDLQCDRCKQIKQDNLMTYCTCAGAYKTLIDPNDTKNLVKVLNKIADEHSMISLKEYTELLVNNI